MDLADSGENQVCNLRLRRTHSELHCDSVAEGKLGSNKHLVTTSKHP